MSKIKGKIIEKGGVNISSVSGNFNKNGKTEAAKHLLSKMKESKSFFNTDKILYKIFFNKLKNSKRDADDILYSTIIEKCIKNSN